MAITPIYIRTHSHTQFIQQLHSILGHLGHSPLAHWFLKRNLKAPIKLLKQAINSSEQCKDTYTFKSLTPPRLLKPFIPTQVLHIDFIGPLHVPFQDKYACTIVDTATGIVYACASRRPHAKTTLKALTTWFAFYGPPQITESDQGTHFTASAVQQHVKGLDIDWTFHLPYRQPDKQKDIMVFLNIKCRHSSQTDNLKHFKQELP